MTNNTTRKALLLSTLSLLLCFAMLLGTTFAWFTDSVTSSGNRIQAGNLKIDLLMDKTEDDTYVSIANGQGDIFSEETGNGILWEPGKTEIVYLGVRNEGTLALKYNIILDIIDGGLIGSLKYAILDGAKAAGLSAVDSWAAIQGIQGVQIGDVKAGTITVAENGRLADVAEGIADKETDYFALAVHMDENAGNEYQGKTVTFNILVNATQAEAEEDSFNNQYDAGAKNPSADNTAEAFVSTAAELEAAVNNAAGDITVYLMGDISGNVNMTQKDGTNVVIDGKDHEYSGVMTVFGNGRQSGAESMHVKNIDFVAANGAGSCIVSPDRSVNNKYSYAHNVTIENCTFTDPDGTVNCAAIRTEDGGDKNWVIKNCTVYNTMHSLLQVQNIEGKLTIDGCTVNSKNGANLNSTTNLEMTNCNFNVTGYAIRFGVNSGGNLGEAKNYVVKNSTLKSANDDGDAVIIFRASAVDANLTLTNTTLIGTPDISGNTAATTITRN